MSAPLLKDVFTIPEATGTEDYVLRLTDATTGDGAREAIRQYVVTPEIASAFGTALALVADAMTTGKNRGAFLAGSFGAGKSHFMAVLHAILRHDADARSIRELQGPIATYDPRLQDKRFLPLAFHFLGGSSMEQVIFEGYVRQIRALHPDAPLPAVYQADQLLADAEAMRSAVGDKHFVGLLGTGGAGDDPFAALLGEDGWSIERYHAARAAAPGTDERRNLITALTRDGGPFASYTRFGDFVSLDEGLAAISAHAQGLGYDAVILFLDELVLWLAFQMQNEGAFGREAQKITKLVEGGYGRLPIPLISFIARQMDLQRWYASSGQSGAHRQALDDAFRHQSGRFATITLGDDNLAHVAARRLLQPKDEAAREAIEAAFASIDRAPGVWDVLLDGVNTDEAHQGASEAQFRLTYPFSPALVDTLRNLSSVMQRDRTALKIMQEMLIDRRETMTIADLIPVGDAYPYIVEGNQDSVLDPERAGLFRSATKLWGDRLKPLILSRHELTEEDLATADAGRLRHYRADERLAHTLLLAAVAPTVPALASLTAGRLAALNHGSIVSLLPNGAPGMAASKVRDWSQDVPEIRSTGSTANPVFTLTLSDVDHESVVEAAKGEDNDGRRRELLRTLFLEAAGIPDADLQADGSLPHAMTWRGSRRTVDIFFGNVRDPQDLPEDRFRAAPGTWRLIIDLPYDDAGHSFNEDVQRIDALRARGLESRTLIWLPRFLSTDLINKVGRLVILEYLLGGNGDRWRAHSDHLPEGQRKVAQVTLDAQRQTLRSTLTDAIAQAYGVASPHGDVLAPGPSSLVLWSLETAHKPQTPGGPTIERAVGQILQAAWDDTYPEHPRFEPGGQVITAKDAAALIDHADRAAGDPEHRIPLQGNHAAVRRIANGLGLGRASETHYILTGTYLSTWTQHLARALSQAGHNPADAVTVRELRDLLRDNEIAQGLDTVLLDTIICVWGIHEQRAWYRYGKPTAEQTVPGRLAPDLELRPQEMPTQDEWEAAVDRAGAIFGVQASPHLTAANVTSLAASVKEKATGRRDSADRLVSALDAACAARRLNSTDRLTAAREGASLVTALAGLSGLPLLRRLASDHSTSTPQELARSLASAEEVAKAAGRIDADRASALEAQARSGGSLAAPAKAALRALDDALSSHERVRPLRAAVDDFERKAWDLMSQAAAAPRPEPAAGSTGRATGRTGRRTLTWSASAGLGKIEEEIASSLSEGARIEISWRELP